MAFGYWFKFYRSRRIRQEERKKILDALVNSGSRISSPSNRISYWDDIRNDWVQAKSEQDVIKHFSESPKCTAIQLWHNFFFTEEKEDIGDYRLGIYSSQNGDWITVMIDGVYVRLFESAKNKKYLTYPNPNIERFLLLAKTVCQELTPEFGVGDCEDFFEWEDSLKTSDIESVIKEKRYRDIFDVNRVGWANFYSCDIVHTIGEKKLMRAPVWKIENLANGMLILLQPNPYPSWEKIRRVKAFIDFLNKN
ncbi:MAG: hypothetical protein QXO75_08770 [Nitrososphaerota archaeon]